LRQAIGSRWRGSHVLVCAVSGTRCVEVVLNDWCACGSRRGYATVLDLSDEAFRYLAPLSRGVIRVAVDIP
jgi:rare lipoprotein A (peptidoglycan hydrolase)